MADHAGDNVERVNDASGAGAGPGHIENNNTNTKHEVQEKPADAAAVSTGKNPTRRSSNGSATVGAPAATNGGDGGAHRHNPLGRSYDPASDAAASDPDVQYLRDDEIAAFLDELDHNGDGCIDYSEVERKLDEVYDELVPGGAQPHNLHHDPKEDRDRHAFLRKLIGCGPDGGGEAAPRIPRDEFAERVRGWRVPSMKQDSAGREGGQGKYLRDMGPWRRARAYWAVHGSSFAFLAMVVGLQVGLGTWQCVKYATGAEYQAAFGWGVALAKSRPENEDAVAALLGPDAAPRPCVAYVRSVPGFTGLTALGLFYALAALSMPQVRRRSYEVFQLAHLLMFPIVGLLAAHGTAQLLQFAMFGYWLALPTVLVLAERLVRLATGLHRIPATLAVLDKDTVEIRATIPSERLWRYEAGQWVYLQVPAISLFQWHPFTVSVCVGKEVRLHIKMDGNWTGRLRELGGAQGERADIQIGINGPFGAPAQRFYDFQHTVLVGVGIGLTPFSGILADLQAKDDRAHGGPSDSASSSHTKVVGPHAEVPGGDQQTAELSKARDSDKTTAPPGPEAAESTAGGGSRQAAARPGTSLSSSSSSSSSSVSRFASDYRRVDFHWMVRERNHLLWVSDLLNTVSRSQAWHLAHDSQHHLDVRVQTHVTQKRSKVGAHVYRWLLEQHRTPEHPASPITGLLNPTQFGRPDFVRILDRHYDDMLRYKAAAVARGDLDADDELKVGVFFCGTPVVGEVLADRCAALTARGRHDGSRIEYHFMIEVFN
ncbi:hypothetical protein GGTG_07177 [Gaeumannomyces tritici R3-111a-1]|uniref:FAD-binding FR-type domain-containing protein n=1 Tax=Gaeumannomyces tritici (strain R3-111a-1) TaxID=644352 RepID=J3P0Y1_GAET3|nr:hypothetical protein GGTG_07177 [Gaeumannomyces tritici R3-111a-1]EJT77265.1 hypothetical protein GGTG_07177 [Gaeumannomyces tritici R3-111a-1]